ncbi:hypothetical protein QWY28_15380 [Nocardioides sp. SOB77]|uniref:Uncharacterized protein n=1 Tax=Nocardioides oceani TaxID=3058369 RepID=A0ABT8FIS8_9ACTN|nr:hypothetical protein [Nocardioides oceani]MDN4174345.1 hypothetical protein [Nocardioides oceani]
MTRLIDSLLTLAAGVLVGAACSAAADALDPVGADARADLTDARLAAFLDANGAVSEDS